jgi:hypothetical protein
MEEFYYTGMKLKEIRDDELYKEDGFETWEKYCRARWQWSKQYAYRLILAAEYRAVLPEVPNGTDGEKREWNEFSMRELRRIPDKKEAARVAKKVIAEVDKTPDAKLTSTLVRKVVDEELGVKRTKSAAPPLSAGDGRCRARKEYDRQAKERQKEGQERGRQKQKGNPVNLPGTETDARDAVGKAVGVSGKSIDYATKVITKGIPELSRAVDEGRIAISTVIDSFFGHGHNPALQLWRKACEGLCLCVWSRDGGRSWFYVLGIE